MEVKNQSHDDPHSKCSEQNLSERNEKEDCKQQVGPPLHLDNSRDLSANQETCLKKSTSIETQECAVKGTDDIQMADLGLDQSADLLPRKKSFQIVTFDDQINQQHQISPDQVDVCDKQENSQLRVDEYASEQPNEINPEPETQKIGLRRQSTRTKTAKNNSEYIYYSKYKEIGSAPGSGPENSSKNGVNSGANDFKKRKYSKKNPKDHDQMQHESAKSAKSNSFQMSRAKNQECQKNEPALIREVGLYPQSCGENNDQCSIGSNNSGNLGISAAAFSIDHNLQKKFNFENEKMKNMSQADGEVNIQTDSKQVFTAMHNSSKDQKRDSTANLTASASKQTGSNGNQNNSGSKAAQADKTALVSKSSGAGAATSKDAALNQQTGVSSSAKGQKQEQKAQTTQQVTVIPQAIDILTGEMPVYCICRSSDENFMICCDRCEEWYHYKCIGISQEQFESLMQSDQPFYCKQKDCGEKEKKLKQTRAKEEAAERKRVKDEKKAQKAVDRAEKNEKAKKKKDPTSGPQVEDVSVVASNSKTTAKNETNIPEQMNVIQSKGNLRQAKDSKANVSSVVPEFLQLPQETTRAAQKKSKNDRASKNQLEQVEQFANESNIDATSNGRKKKRDRKQDQKLTDISNNEESILGKSKKNKKERKLDKQGNDKKTKTKSRNSDSEKNAKEQKKQKTVFVQPGQTNPLQMKMFGGMGLPLGSGLGGLPGLGVMPTMMGGMNHPMSLGNHLANLRAHQMLANQLAAKQGKTAVPQANTKGLPSLNLFKGMNQMVGKKRPAIPLEPLNLLGNLMNFKSNPKKTEVSQEASSSKISNSDNNSGNGEIDDQKSPSFQDDEQASDKEIEIAHDEGPLTHTGKNEAASNSNQARALSNSQSGPSGNVKSVYESENYYHMVLKNSSSTKAQTQVGGDSEEAAEGECIQNKEFKFAKVDLYQEKKQAEEKQPEDYSNLFNLMNINKDDNSFTNLDSVIEQLCQTESSIDVDKIAQDLYGNEALSEAFQKYDMTDEDRTNLKLLNKSLKLQKIIDRIQQQQTSEDQKYLNQNKQGCQQYSKNI